MAAASNPETIEEKLKSYIKVHRSCFAKHLDECERFFKNTDTDKLILVHSIVEKEEENPGICKIYLKGLNDVGLDDIFATMETPDQKLFFIEAHLQPAVCESNYELVRELLSFAEDSEICSDFYKTIHKKRAIWNASDDDPRISNLNKSRYYNRSILEMAVDNGHRPILHLVVHSEYLAHKQRGKVESGLKCFELLPRSAPLRREAAQAFNNHRGKKSNKWGTILSSGLEVLSVYFFLFFDLTFDIFLIRDYYNYSRFDYQNHSATFTNGSDKTAKKSLVQKNLTCLGRSSKERSDSVDKFSTAFTTSVVAIGVSVFVIWIVLCLSIKLKKNRAEYLCFLMRPIYAVVLFFRYSYMSKMYPDDPNHRENYKTWLKAWKRVQKVKIGLETISQMLIGLWVLTLFYDDIENHSFRDLYKIFKLGFAQMLISTTWCSEFMYVMLAKHLISSLFLCINVTVLRTQKKPQRLADSPVAFLIYFLATGFQLLMRSITFFVLFTQRPWIQILFVSTHFVTVLLVKVFIELRVLAWRSYSCLKADLTVLIIAELLVSTIASSLTFVSMDMSKLRDKNGELKRTFQPYFAHFVQIFVELFIVTNLTKEGMSSIKFFVCPLISGFISVLLLFIYYKFIHKSGAFEGIRPSFVSPSKKRIEFIADSYEMQPFNGVQR